MSNRAGIHVYYCGNSARGAEFPPALTRLEVRSDVHVEAVPCSGRIDPRYLLKAFESGAEAVCVLACPSGHCKTMQGNLRASRRISAVRQLIAEAGLDPNALQVFLPGGPEVGALEAAVESVVRFVNASRQPAEKVAVQ